jgi:membrane-bound serine protease (ClpP class)
VLARHLRRAREHAEENDAACLLVELDTPGGMVISTREIVRELLASRVPVVVWVGPAGARAASAGLFIVLASHVAAMAPGTHIGAAHPVPIGGLPTSPNGGDEAKRSPMEDKMVNDTRAWARTLAQLRGRNGDWAERAVSESLTLTGLEAQDRGVVDLVADDPQALLAAIDGRVVELGDGSRRTLRTEHAEIVPVPMWWGDRLLSVLANPNIAFLLVIFGFYGLLFELYTPGVGVSGVAGAVCLVLGLAGLAVLPVTYAGGALLLVGLGLLVAEGFVVSYGALTAAGAACLFFGGLMLIDSPPGFMRVSLGVALPVAVATSLIAVFLVGSVVRAQRGAKARTGTEAMIGEVGTAATDFVAADDGFRGTIFVHGEHWAAHCDEPASSGSALEVASRHGLTLDVTSAKEAHSS